MTVSPTAIGAGALRAAHVSAVGQDAESISLRAAMVGDGVILLTPPLHHY